MRLAISLLFLVHGLIEASWVSRIPAIQQKLHANTGALGLALLGSALGAIVSMPFTGWLLERFNSRTVIIVASLANCAALPLMALAPNTWFLLAALILYGAGGGAMDIAINAAGVEIDRIAPRPVMSSFHGLYSLGGMLGAFLGALIAREGVLPKWHLLCAAAVLATTVVCIRPLLLSMPVQPSDATHFALPPRALLGIGALAFCILFGERAMADWTGIYLVRLGASNAFAAAGFAIFSAAMTIGRFGGDWLIHRFGETRMLQYGSGFAAAGLTLGLATGTPGAGLLGFACIGAGFSFIVPILFRAGGRTPGISTGVGVAAVTTMGYMGFLTGPPIIGFAAQVTSLRAALALVAVLSGAVAFAAKPILAKR